VRSRDVLRAAQLLWAWRRGEEGPEALAGAMLEAAQYLAHVGEGP